MAKLTTIGYEGANPEDFLATLLAAGVETVLDIRDVPISRRKGFSKGVLSQSLQTVGIKYVHLKGLGDPKEGREAARQGNYVEFVRIFEAHMKTATARSDLERAAAIASSSPVCLLCYERDPIQCHRKLVATELSAIVGVDILHIGVRKGLASSGSSCRAGRGSHIGEGIAANG